jgi:hypothetical protein
MKTCYYRSSASTLTCWVEIIEIGRVGCASPYESVAPRRAALRDALSEFHTLMDTLHL